MAHAHGTLEDTTVLVRDQDQVNRLQDKGTYGVRVDEGLALDLYEAAYLVEADRLKVTRPGETSPLELPQLLALGSRSIEGFETDHLVYRDYRSRGFVLRRGETGELDGWTRGAAPPRQAPSTLLAPRGEAEFAEPRLLVDLVDTARKLGRKLLLGVADEESDVTYYEADRAEVAGQVEDPAPELAPQARAVLLRDRAVLLDDPGFEGTGYGHAAGGERFLTLIEARHLAEHGLGIEDADGTELSVEAVAERARSLHPDADVSQDAYAWLRGQGLVPKTGFKFGVHFRIYQEDPGESHAPFLVQASPTDAPWTYRDVARFVRLSHSVKKKPIVWCPEGAVMIQWTRP